jgi:hypothetical protein
MSRYALVAETVSAGGMQPVQVTTVASLANKKLFAFAHCSYTSITGPQGQDVAHDAQTVFLSFDNVGNATRSSAPPSEGAYFDQVALSAMLTGTVFNGRAVAAYKVSVAGVDRLFLIERTFYDEISATEGSLTLWIEE